MNWISVKDRLPEAIKHNCYSRLCLVVYFNPDFDNAPIIGLARRLSNSWRMFGGYDVGASLECARGMFTLDSEYVTYWMDIPDLPLFSTEVLDELDIGKR